MFRLAVITLIAVVASACAQSPTQPTDFEQAIRQELDALGRAVVQRDAGAIHRLVADDFTFTRPNSVVSGKKELLAMAESEVFAYERHDIVAIKVRSYGITAVSNGQFMLGTRSRGQRVVNRVQFTTVHVRQDGRWQLVALHSTVIRD